MRSWIRRAALIGALVQAGVAFAADRVELPVREVVLSDGTRRYAVPLTVDGRPVEAGLDTGSTGLRVMARGLPAAQGRGERVHYGYGSGTVLDGTTEQATIGFGTLTGDVRIERVDGLSCSAKRPQCPVLRNGAPATFGIQGNGLPGQGFVAILGVNLRAAPVGNPFEALGARRWIVELPRPGDGAPGRIVLNPSDAEIAGYTRYRLLADDNSLAGCVTGPAPLGRVCGPATLDTGAPGLRITGARLPGPVPNGTPLTLTLGDAKAQAMMQVETGRRDQASSFELDRRPDAGGPRLFFGSAPYFRWSVLYDADAHTIGLKPR